MRSKSTARVGLSKIGIVSVLIDAAMAVAYHTVTRHSQARSSERLPFRQSLIAPRTEKAVSGTARRWIERARQTQSELDRVTLITSALADPRISIFDQHVMMSVLRNLSDSPAREQALELAQAEIRRAS